MVKCLVENSGMFTSDRLKEADPSFSLRSTTNVVEQITAPCSLEHLHENGIIFIKNKKFYDKLRNVAVNGNGVRSMGVIFQESFLKSVVDSAPPVFLNQFRFYATVKSVDLALSRYSKLFFDKFEKERNDLVDGRQTKTASIHPASRIADGVFLGEGVEIAADVVIHTGCVLLSNSKIGEGTVLYPNVVIYRNVTIGKDCRIHANTTIGSDGFGYNNYEGEHLKVWHFGGVTIGDSVEIGSNTSIDQGTFSPTVIGSGSKIDNQVHIAHNCRLGTGVIICGQAGLAGSVTLGDYVVVGGAANIAPNVVVGNYAQIGGMAGVTGHVPEKGAYGGHPARPINEWLKSSARLRSMSLRKNGKAEESNGSS